MADFKTADICGASPNLNGVLEKMDSLKNSLSSSLTVDPSSLASTLSSEVSALSSSLSSMIPDLPSASDVSLQAELTALSNIDLTLPSGLLEYRSKLDSITNQFGDSLTASGFSLDSLVSQVAPSIPSLPGAPSVDLCSVVPNFKLPDGATEATEAAAETLMADAPGVAEEVATVTANAEVKVSQEAKDKELKGVSEGTTITKATETIEVSTDNTGIVTVGASDRKVERPEDNFSTTTVERSTSTEVISESGGEETIVVAERPREYPNGNYYDRASLSVFYFNSAIEEVKDLFNELYPHGERITGDESRARRARFTLNNFRNNKFYLREVPFRISEIFVMDDFDPACILETETSVEFHRPRFRRRHVIFSSGGLYGKDGELGINVNSASARLNTGTGYEDINDPFEESIRLNFSETRGESYISLRDPGRFGFIKINYQYFKNYDASFKDIKQV